MKRAVKQMLPVYVLSLFANELGNTYRDKSKYFIPETFEEFEEYCKKIGIGRK